MNARSYRLVFSKRLGMYVPASEVCNAQAGKRRNRRAKAGVAALLASLTVLPAWAIDSTALPTGQVVKSGDIAFQNAGNTLNINQASQNGIIHWNNFNIGSAATVNFNQPNVTSATLNRIVGGEQSVIQGAMNATGAVYVINRNGILFDKGAQVNLHTLIASTLDIKDDDLFLNGYRSAGNDTPAFAADYNSTGLLNMGSAPGAVEVAEGAYIGARQGGKIMLVGADADNRGVIETNGGQIMLAAGKKLYVHTPKTSDNADSLLNGVVVAVESGGTARNLGALDAGTGGDVTLIGALVRQEGTATAMTTVNLNGTIHLLAQHINPDNARRTILNRPSANTMGEVVFGENSRTAVMPALDADKVKAGLASGDLSQSALDAYRRGESIPGNLSAFVPDETMQDSQTFTPSRIFAQGKTIHVQNGASLVAPSGEITLFARDNNERSDSYLASDRGDVSSSFLTAGDDGETFCPDCRVQVDAGARIDVSGLDVVPIAMERNVVEVELSGAALADAPMLHGTENKFYEAMYGDATNPLYFKKVKVDIREGTTLADASGYIAGLGRKIDEKSTAGGKVNLYSEGGVVVRSGSTIDLSGGSLAYQDGEITTSQLLYKGRLYDITTATPDKLYSGLGSDKTVRESGYTEGKDAGTLTIIAPAVALQGALKANTVAGINQRGGVGAALPRSGELILGFAQSALGTVQDYRLMSKVSFGAVTDDAPAFGTSLWVRLNDEQKAALGRDLDLNPAMRELVLDPVALKAGGIGHLTVYTNNAIELRADQALDMGAGGSVKLTGAQIDIAGDIAAPGGSVSLASQWTVFNDASARLGMDPVPFDQHVIIDGAVSTAGQWTNDYLDRTLKVGYQAVTLNGGDISVSTEIGELRLGENSLLDASAGAWLKQDGKSLKTGKGGDITLTSASLLSPGGNLRSYGVADSSGKVSQGGTLGLETPFDIAIGGAPSVDAGDLHLAEAFFTQGGFSGYAVESAQGSLTVADGANVAPRAFTRVVSKGEALTSRTGSDMAGFSSAVWLDKNAVGESVRSAADLDLKATQISVGKEARIDLDALAALKMEAGRIAVEGDLSAPGGTITLKAGSPGGQYSNNVSIWIGSGADLSVAGQARTYRAAGDLIQGEVLDGGRIGLLTGGYLMLESGASLDASGALGRLDLPVDGDLGIQYVRTALPSSGGSIRLAASEGLFVQEGARLAARGGNGAAEAGTLRVELDRPPVTEAVNLATYPVDPDTGAPYAHRLHVYSDAGAAMPDNLTAPGAPLRDADDASGALSLSHLANFDHVELKSGDRIVFKDSLRLDKRGTVTLDAPNLALDGADVTVNALYVDLGNGDPIKQADAQAATSGEGRLTITASLIDLTGAFALQGAKETRLTSYGDLRLVGVVDAIGDTTLTPRGKFSTAGDVTVQAAQTYAATLSEYTLESTKAGGTISFAGWHAGNGSLYVPYAPQAAGGAITVTADNISQAGVLRAPIGSIALQAADTLTLTADSLTSVSADGLAISFGRVTNGETWVYDFYKPDGSIVSRTLYSGGDGVADIPTKRIELSGATVDVQDKAVVDLSGGGDLVASEFAAGSGGSLNYLAQEGVFAIIPAGAYATAYAAADHQASQYRYLSSDGKFTETGAVKKTQAGEMVYLSAIPELGIAAGYYAVLPAQYALLPGAYAVRAVSGSTDMTAGQNHVQPDGSHVAAGFTTALGTVDTGAHRWSGFEVASRAVVATNADFSFNIDAAALKGQTLTGRSEITDYRMGALVPVANATYALAVPRLAADAGRLSLSAEALSLDGTLDFGKSTGGLGGELDIASSRVAITDGAVPVSLADASGYLVLDAGKLADYDVDSLMIGGTRHAVDGDASVLRVDQVAETVVLETSLSAPEVMLVSKGSVTLTAGAQVRGEGNGGVSGETLIFGDADAGVSGDGVLVRASSGDLRGVTRRNISRAGGADYGLFTAADSLVHGEKSVNLDATYTAFNLGKVGLGDQGALQLGATRVALGEVTDIIEGVFVTNELLDSLGNPEEIVLKSYSNFDVYGNARLGNADTSSLTLQGAGFAGVKTGLLDIEAGKVGFANADGTAFDAASAAGAGAMVVKADHIHFGAGAIETAGFDSVTLTARGEIAGIDAGKGGLTVTRDLSMEAQRIVGYDGSETTFSAGGKLTTARYLAGVGEALPELGRAPLGARMNFVGGTGLDHGGNIEMPAGWLTMTAATGDLNLLAGSNIFAGGVVRRFHGVDDYVNVYVAGGLAELAAEEGDVNIASGAVVDVSGRDLLTSGQSASPVYDGKGSADAGALNIYARGDFKLEGELKGGAVMPDANLAGLTDEERVRRPAGGALIVDASTMTDALGTLIDRSSGFSEEFSLRLRTGDLVLEAGKTLVSKRVNLSADAGVVDLAGTIDARAAGGGWVRAAAGKELYLRNGARIDASATGAEQQGGEVWLISGMDTEHVASNENAGALVLENGSAIAVAGTLTDDSRTSESVGGRVHLQAPRLESGEDVRITQAYGVFDDNAGKGAIGTAIRGASLIEAVGNKVFDSGYDIVSTTQTNKLKTDTQTYMDTAAAAKTRLGGSALGGDATFHFRPGVELRSDGDMKFSKDFDLGTITAVSGGEPGVLTLRAGGNLLIEGNLSDGFNTALATATTLDNGDSWSYRLVAGSDLSAADPMAVQRQVEMATGDFVLKAGKLIRTGTGSIEVAAAGDIEIGLSYGSYDADAKKTGDRNAASVIYTAGRADLADTRLKKPKDNLYKAVNTVDGGGISLSAGEAIRAPEVVELMNQWLVKRGEEKDGAVKTALTWGVDFRYFDQGVGALGGGDVRVRAGTDIENLSVSLATTGRDYATTDIGTDIVETGGGDLNAVAGGDILGAVFYVQKGEGRVRSGDSIGAMPESDDKHLLLALGESSFRVDARNGLTLESAFNPTVAPMGSKVASAQASQGKSSYFFTYGEGAGIELVSAQGDLILNNDETLKVASLENAGDLAYGGTGDETMYLVYPGSLVAAAVNGDVHAKRAFYLYPSALGKLHLLAQGGVMLGNQITMSDQSVDALSTTANPGLSVFVGPAVLDVAHAPVPVHVGNDDPVRIYAESGDIAGTSGMLLTAPKSVELLAGRDIVDVSVTAQNINARQTSTFQAGRDIRYSASRNNGNLVGSGEGIRLGGPGYVEIMAGRNIDLGTVGGIAAQGNLSNPNLIPGSADIVVLSGMGAETDEQGVTRVRLPEYEAFLVGVGESARADYLAGLMDYEMTRQALLDPDNATLDYAGVLARLDDADYRARMKAAAAGDYALAVATFESLRTSDVAADRAKAARLLYFSELQQASDEASLLKQLTALGFDLADLNQVGKPGVADGYLATLAEAGLSAASLENFARLFDRTAALNKAHDGQADYRALNDLGYAGRADKAVAALLPEPDYSGGFKGFYSQMRTEQGSAIDMLTPGGDAVVGLVNAEKLDRADSQMGLFTVNGGSIRSYSEGDFLVNRSRVFTLGWQATQDRTGDQRLLRDDIFLFSSEGDVDAGKGAKTATSTPPPTITTDDKGFTTSDISSSISGSGIGVLLAREVINRGDTFLIAPNGTVSAGDAGIRASGSLFIDANRVVGADNIVVVGVSVGVPAAVDTSGLSVSGVGSIGDAAKAASEAATSVGQATGDAQKAADEMKQKLANFKPSFISVDVLGFGAGTRAGIEDEDEEKRRRRIGRG